MTLVLDDSVGGASANTFASLAEATAYMDSRLNGSAWTSATEDDQNRALVEATRELSAMAWKGQRVTETQALAWPRAWVETPDAAWPGVSYIDSSVIPQAVQDATCELAFQFLKAGTTDLAVIDPNDNVRVKTVDVLTTEYFEPYQRKLGLARFPRILNLIRPLLAASGSSVPVVRG